MEVRIIFKDATAEKVFKKADNVYTKGGLLVVREGDWLFKYPLTEIFSVVHKHGKHWGSNVHRAEEGLECEAEENPPADKIDKPRKHLPRETLNSKTMINNVTADNVNHPSHYTSGQIEVIDFIEDKELGFHLGNAVKYISRAGRKDQTKTIEDLRKAVWYINRQIQRLECKQSGQN